MVPKSIVMLVILSLFHISQSWILYNDVRTRTIQDNMLDEDLEDLTPEELARLRFSLIYPGTKWCGPGNVAENYDELGPSREADACCRDHDNCPEYIPAGDTKHNLTNHSYFTRMLLGLPRFCSASGIFAKERIDDFYAIMRKKSSSRLARLRASTNRILNMFARKLDSPMLEHFIQMLSCHCDETFRRCMQNASTKTSNTIGYMYFNVIGTKCYREDYLITGCKQHGGWLDTKCVEYSYNTSSEKTYQWFDVPNFSSARLFARPRLN